MNSREKYWFVKFGGNPGQGGLYPAKTKSGKPTMRPSRGAGSGLSSEPGHYRKNKKSAPTNVSTATQQTQLKATQPTTQLSEPTFPMDAKSPITGANLGEGLHKLVPDERPNQGILGAPPASFLAKTGAWYNILLNKSSSTRYPGHSQPGAKRPTSGAGSGVYSQPGHYRNKNKAPVSGTDTRRRNDPPRKPDPMPKKPRRDPRPNDPPRKKDPRPVYKKDTRFPKRGTVEVPQWYDILSKSAAGIPREAYPGKSRPGATRPTRGAGSGLSSQPGHYRKQKQQAPKPPMGGPGSAESYAAAEDQYGVAPDVLNEPSPYAGLAAAEGGFNPEFPGGYDTYDPFQPGGPQQPSFRSPEDAQSFRESGQLPEYSDFNRPIEQGPAGDWAAVPNSGGPTLPGQMMPPEPAGQLATGVPPWEEPGSLDHLGPAGRSTLNSTP